METTNSILPVVYPPVNAFPHQGAVFSMLYGRKECKPWIFNNYIQTFTIRDMYKDSVRSGTIDFFYNQYGDWKYFEMKANPWIRFYSIPISYFQRNGMGVIEVIEEAIANQRYLFFAIDRYYIPAYERYYGKEHLEHEIFVYGINKEEKAVFFSDNINNKYQQTQVGFEDLHKSVRSIADLYQREEEKFYYSEKAFFLMEIRKNAEVAVKNDTFLKETYNINLYKITNDVREYLLDSNCTGKYRNSHYYRYGLDCYEELTKLIIYSRENRMMIDIRAFYSFLQHKRLMLLRMKYLETEIVQAKLSSRYCEITDEFEKLILLIIRYNLEIQKNKYNYSIIEYLFSLVKKIKSDEEEALNHFLITIMQ